MMLKYLKVFRKISILLIFIISNKVFATECYEISTIQKIRNWAVTFFAKLQVDDVKYLNIPCSLDESFNQQEIYFVGDEHYTKKEQNNREPFFQLAIDGKIKLLTEVSKNSMALENLNATQWPNNPEMRNPNVLGIEHPDLSALTLSYMMQKNLLSYPTKENILSTLQTNLASGKLMPIFKTTFNKYKNFKSSCQKCVEFLKTNQNKSTKELSSLFNQESHISENEWLDYLNEFHSELIKVAKNLPEIKRQKIQLFSLTKAKDIPQFYNEKNTRDMLFGQLSRIRSLHMGQVLINQLCKNKNNNKKLPIVIMAGTHHIEDILPMFFTLSGEKIPNEIYKNYEPKSSKLILKYLTKK